MLWKVKSVNPRKTPEVKNKACKTIRLSMYEVTIPMRKLSQTVKAPSRIRLLG